MGHSEEEYLQGSTTKSDHHPGFFFQFFSKILWSPEADSKRCIENSLAAFCEFRLWFYGEMLTVRTLTVNGMRLPRVAAGPNQRIWKVDEILNIKQSFHTLNKVNMSTVIFNPNTGTPYYGITIYLEISAALTSVGIVMPFGKIKNLS